MERTPGPTLQSANSSKWSRRIAVILSAVVGSYGLAVPSAAATVSAVSEATEQEMVIGQMAPIASFAVEDYVDVTTSAQGRAVAEEATTRWAQTGELYRDISHVKVLEAVRGESRSTIVMPTYLRLVDASVEDDHGFVTSTTEVELSLARALGAAEGVGSSWNRRNSDCLSRKENSTGWLDECWRIHQYKTTTTDGSSTRDIYQFHHFASFKQKGIWRLHRAWIESRRNQNDWVSPPFYSWEDWSPKSDTTGNCSTFNVSVSYLGAGISAAHNRCEEWRITKYSEVGRFKNEWRSGMKSITSTRELGYMTVVKVGQYAQPIWTVSSGFTTNPYW
jgi:hypothetical protein